MPSPADRWATRSLRGDEQAYVLYKRFLVLAVEGIPQHNAFSNPRYQKDRAWLEKVRVGIDNWRGYDGVFPTFPVPPPDEPERSAREYERQARLSETIGGGGGRGLSHANVRDEDSSAPAARLHSLL